MSLFRGVTFFRDLSNNYEFAKLAINWGLLLIKATRQKKKKKRILFLISIAVSYCWRSIKDLNHEGSRKWYLRTAAPAKSLQSCPTLCDPIDSSPPGSPNPGILQARTQEWVAISFSNAWKWKVKVKLLSHIRLFVSPWTAAHQAPLSIHIFYFVGDVEHADSHIQIFKFYCILIDTD